MDQILTVLLTTEMFVGGCLAFILDNTVPGMGQPWEGNRELGWTQRQSSRCLLSRSCGQVRCNASGPAGRSRNRWAGGRDHQPDRGTGFPLSLEEGVARRDIPGPCKVFLFHFFVATGLRVAFAFLE